MKRLWRFLLARLRKRLLEEIWLEDYVRLGMKIGDNCSIQPGVVFDYSHCWLITIGSGVTIAPQAYILAHDASTKRWSGLTRVGAVTIEDGAFIGARAIIMPGVTVGEGAVVAAGSVVTKDVPPHTVAAGNPARVIATADEYRAKTRRAIEAGPTFGREYTLAGGATPEARREMRAALAGRAGFVE